MSEITIGSVVRLKSDIDNKVIMTVEGLARGRREPSEARITDYSCVWVDDNGTVMRDDFGIEALISLETCLDKTLEEAIEELKRIKTSIQ